MAEVVLIVHAFATLAMVGLIWFVQIVHYPLMGSVGGLEFPEYEREHQRRTTLVVAPLMLTEAATALLLLVLRPERVGIAWVWIGVALLAGLWASTFFWQVPVHTRLAERFDAGDHRRLVRSNWVRTFGWSLRGVLVAWMCFAAAAGNSTTAVFTSVVNG